MKKVGYIGLGIMGSSMTRNLMKAGYELVVHNRSRAIVDQLASEGAKPANSPKEVAEQVEFVFTNLPDSPDVEQVVLGENGIIEGAHEGLIFVDNSTIKPETARMVAARLAEKGVASLDAPVSGGDIGARDGTLTIMVGGDEEAFNKTLPLFEAMGKTVVLVGESGAGQIAKVCNQIITASQIAALCEALTMAQKSGVDPEKVIAAIKNGAARMWALEVKAPDLLAGKRTPGFKGYMHLKDLNIVLDTGRAYGVVTPLSTIAQQLFQSMVQQGDGEMDNTAVLNVYERLSNTQIGPVDFRNTNGK